MGVRLVVICIFMFFVSCSKKTTGCNDDELTLERKSYAVGSININGYYIEDKPISEKYIEEIFLFENGITLGFSDDNSEATRSGSIDVPKTNRSLKSKAAWGVFRVNDSLIELEHWTPSASGCFKTQYERCNVLNDTTLVVTQIEYREAGKIVRSENVKKVFNFKPLLIKPDSTNNFIP